MRLLRLEGNNEFCRLYSVLPSVFRPDVFGRSGENLFVFIYFQMLSSITSHSITVSLFFRFRPNFLYLRSIFLPPIRPEFFSFFFFLFIYSGRLFPTSLVGGQSLMPLLTWARAETLVVVAAGSTNRI
jgi:hypothetical protein